MVVMDVITSDVRQKPPWTMMFDDPIVNVIMSESREMRFRAAARDVIIVIYIT